MVADHHNAQIPSIYGQVLLTWPHFSGTIQGYEGELRLSPVFARTVVQERWEKSEIEAFV